MNTFKSLKAAAKHNRGRMGLREAARQLGLDVSKLTSNADAKEIWEHLNDLAENDPAAYQAYLREQQEQFAKEKQEATELVPTPGFTVKTFLRGHKLFINCCAHKRLQPPQDAAARPVDVAKDVLVNTSGMTIPMLIGRMRDCKDHEGKSAKVVDVIFHPWVIEQAEKVDKGFKAQVAELALGLVKEEFALDLPLKRYKLIRSRYKGGRMVNGQLCAVPHRLEDGEEEEENMMENPSNVLKKLREREEQEDGEAAACKLELPMPSSSLKAGNGKDKPTLIEEVGKKAGKKQKGRNAVQKGFLNHKSANLYPEGSKEGAPTSIFQKCKIVDMSQMDETKTKEAMMTHAIGSKKLEEVSTRGPTRDAFDELAEKADPGMRPSNVVETSTVAPDQMFSELSESLSMMPGFLESTTEQASEVKVSEEKEPEMMVEMAEEVVTIRIDLPDCSDLKKVKVDVSRRRLKLHAKGTYKLDRELGVEIDDSSIQAKFSKKRRQLVVNARRAHL